MIKLIFILIFIPSICFAEVSGYLFFGYLTEKQTLESIDVKYKAGIYLEFKKKDTRLYLQDETYMRDIENFGSYPKQINYKIGIGHKMDDFELILQHECLHPVDGQSGGTKAETHNLIEGRYLF